MKILIFILLLPASLFSQSGFNRIYATDSTKVDFTHIVADNDTLFVVGMEKSLTAGKWDLLIAKMDTFGNYIQKIRRISDLGYLTGDTKAIKTSDNGYLIHSSHAYERKGFALKLNHDLEEVFLKTTYDSINFTVLDSEVVEVFDGYIIGGYVQMSTWDSQAWAMKLDYEGNEIWHHRYGAADTSEYIFAMEVMPNESVLLTGMKNNYEETGPNVMHWIKPWSIKINPTDGEIIWEKNYAIDADERIATDMSPLPDGGYLSGGIERTNESPATFKGRLSLRKLDENGSLVWRKLYGPIINNSPTYFYGISPMPDGRFVATARGRTSSPSSANGFVRAAITICFNPEDGEEYWTRVDTIPIDTINNENNYVQGGTVLSSGSVVVAGYNNTGRSYGWLLKMDKKGCIQDDCETYTAVEDVREVVALPVLFPNPAESYFRIKGEHEGGIGVYSVSGRLVKAVAENLTFGEIRVGDLPKGLYFVRGQTDGRVWVLKLVRRAGK